MTNSITLSGKINWDVKVHQTSKSVMASFPLNFYNGKDKDGENMYANVNCVAFGKQLCDALVNSGKGASVLIHGSLRVNSYEKDGKKVYNTNIFVDDVAVEG